MSKTYRHDPESKDRIKDSPRPRLREIRKWKSAEHKERFYREAYSEKDFCDENLDEYVSET